MNKIIDKLSFNPAFQEFLNESNHLGNLNVNEEALMIYSLFKKKKKGLLIVKNNLYSAQKLYERLYPLLKEDVLLFSVEESNRIEAIASSPELLAKQIELLNITIYDSYKVVITHTAGFTKYLPDPNEFKQYSYSIKVGDIVNYDEMKRKLYESGYERVNYVDQPLCYASRGGIIDVYSMNYEYPIRIEFFDDEIDSIRFFDIESKRTIQTINEVDIIPASDILFNENERKYIINYLRDKQIKYQDDDSLLSFIEEEIGYIETNSKERRLHKYYSLFDQTYSIKDYLKDNITIISNIEEVQKSYQRINEENISYVQELYSMKESLPMYITCNDLYKLVKNCMQIHLFVDEKNPILSQIEEISYLEMPIDKKILAISNFKDDYCIIFDIKKKEKEEIINILDINNISYDENDELINGIHFVNYDFYEGFICNYEKIMVYTSKELFNVVIHRNRYANKFKNAEMLNNYQDLERGDYVVHKTYGVGQFLGIVNKEKDGIHRDYLRIVYKGNDELLVPLEQFKLIRKFVSKEGAKPKLNKLGSGDWEKTKAKVSASVKELAERLVNLYAIREQHIGHAFAKDTPFQKEFEDDFDYSLTKDQSVAIQEIKQDMEKDIPMDRLLCGDVGFGKTEVAFRAAFKAIMDNKQVAFLCPTTILSQQHLNTAIHRFRHFPITIKVVNRFVPNNEIKTIKEDLKNGKIDLLIGTHRLLSKDIKFNDLGLLIIDEEQRFGVEHKEKIKELKNSIDVLSLSATPIPRTLQMSLIGVRSLSQLNTPPNNRISVQTYVIEKNRNLMKEVIERELSRDGQVFYLFNNVKEIYMEANRLSKELKDVKIGVAHGKMTRNEIEDVMMKFNNKEYQVLVCTTIIETGIDIPNANTIIIENADCFGLSQLYQIKGRVGRSDRLAYAYLMYNPGKQLSEIATKRLKSMKEFAKLGSGYKIALRDLTIRGAGDMLGPKQAGFIDTIGMDMYIEMLQDAINESKGIVKEEEKEIKRSNLKVDAYIPEKFEEADIEKISLYQRLDKIHTKQELLDMYEEIEDTYGKLPQAVKLLFEKKQLDILLNDETIDSFKEHKKNVEIIFTKEWSDSIDGIKLFERMSSLSKDIRLKYADKKIHVTLIKDNRFLPILIELLSITKKL